MGSSRLSYIGFPQSGCWCIAVPARQGRELRRTGSNARKTPNETSCAAAIVGLFQHRASGARCMRRRFPPIVATVTGMVSRESSASACLPSSHAHDEALRLRLRNQRCTFWRMAGDALDALQITVVTPTAEWRPQFLPAGSYGDSATIERSAVDRQCALMRSIIGGSLSDFYRARKWQHLLASLPRWCLPLIRKHLM
jgi:hypothetical protein